MGPRSKDIYHALNERNATYYGAPFGRSKEMAVWPYKTPSPEFMAKSGFYFTPTKKYKDRITCYCCGKTQSGWKDVKNPTSYHLEANPLCYYSQILHYAEERSSNPQFEWSNIDIFNRPLDKEASNLRKLTFGKFWPHDSVKGSNPTSQRMADAGFYYSPLEIGDDLAICVYCGTSLEGWESEDDPWEEHIKRSSNCYFLRMDEANKDRTSIKGSKINESYKNRKAENAEFPSSKDSVSTIVKKHRRNLDETQTTTTDGSKISFDSSINVTRPKRLRKLTKKILSDELRSDDMNESDDMNGSDESYGITANSNELEKVEYSNSSRKTTRSINKSSSPKKYTRLLDSTSDIGPISENTKSISPQKKQNILDTSLDDDMFSQKKIQNIDLSNIIRPDSRLSAAKSSQKESTPILADVTNITKIHNSSPPKAFKTITSSKLEDDGISLARDASRKIPENGQGVNKSIENSTLLSDSTHSAFNNNKNVVKDCHLTEDKSSHETFRDLEETRRSPLNRKHETSVNIDSGARKDSETSELRHSSDRERASGNLENEPTETEKPLNPDSFSTTGPALKRLKSSNSSKDQGTDLSTRSLKNSPRGVSKFASPKRSQSPFLDVGYRGSDRIVILGSKEPIIGSDDIPLEESTDHNIVLGKETTQMQVSKSVSEESPLLKPISPESDLGSSSLLLIDNGEISPSRQNQDTLIENKDWVPTDTNRLFERLEDLETTKNYLKELEELDYELNDDIDGRVTFFINQMPEAELDMSIQEWIYHIAKEGRKHLEDTCLKMIDQFDEECERALKKLKGLPVN